MAGRQSGRFFQEGGCKNSGFARIVPAVQGQPLGNSKGFHGSNWLGKCITPGSCPSLDGTQTDSASTDRENTTMAALQIHQEELAGRITLRLEGTLDWRTAVE